MLFDRSDIDDGIFKGITFVQWTVRQKEREENKFITVSSKKIILYPDMTVDVYVMDKEIGKEKIELKNDFVSFAAELEKAVEIFNRFKICEGCASPNTIENIEKTTLFRDSLGFLRHKQCNLLLNLEENGNKKYCLPCKKARNTISNKIVRLKRQQDLQRIVFKGQHIDRKKMGLVNKKFRNVSQRLKYNKDKKDLLMNRISNLKIKMNSMNPLTIDEELKKKNVSDNEKIVITEILKAAKCKSRKGHKYSDDWILLCLIFHMKSPTTYNLLRETQVLPLPCRSTIKK